jgi:hypothetical protein
MSKSPPPSIRVIGIAAYRREDYPRILKITRGCEQMHRTKPDAAARSRYSKEEALQIAGTTH